jgi:hypothetical protein
VNLEINRRDIEWDLIEGEVILLNLTQGLYYSLEGCAAQLWSWLADGYSWDSIVANVGGPEVELSDWVSKMREENLLLPSAADGKEFSPPADFTYQTPRVQRFSDMQDLLLIDPIHDVDEQGWPVVRLS